MQRIALAPDHEISRVIRGGWQMAGGHGAIDSTEAVADMVAFADAGITAFDCADIYTGVEELIGDPRDRDVGDLELFLPQQVQKQVERPGEGIELDDEPGARAEGGRRGFGGGHA